MRGCVRNNRCPEPELIDSADRILSGCTAHHSSLRATQLLLSVSYIISILYLYVKSTLYVCRQVAVCFVYVHPQSRSHPSYRYLLYKVTVMFWLSALRTRDSVREDSPNFASTLHEQRSIWLFHSRLYNSWDHENSTVCTSMNYMRRAQDARNGLCHLQLKSTMSRLFVCPHFHTISCSMIYSLSITTRIELRVLNR